MLAAPAPTRTPSPPSKEEAYTRNQIRQLLDILCRGEFLTYTKEKLFQAGAGNAREVLETILHQKLDKEENPGFEPDIYIAIIKKEVATHNEATPGFKIQLKSTCEERVKLQEKATKAAEDATKGNKVENTQEEFDKEIALLEQKIGRLEVSAKEIDDYDWAVTCKLAIQKGPLLKGNLESGIVRKIFLEDIKGFLKYFNAFLEVKNKFEGKLPFYMRFEEGDVRPHFKNFIAQLCHWGDAEAAEMIHNYFHLAHRLAKENPNLTEAEIAMSFSASFFDGIKASTEIELGVICDKKHLRRDTYEFLKVITLCFIGDPIFSKPFERRFYASFKQERFSEEYAKATARGEVLKASGGDKETYSIPPAILLQRQQAKDSLRKSSATPTPNTIPSPGRSSSPKIIARTGSK